MQLNDIGLTEPSMHRINLLQVEKLIVDRAYTDYSRRLSEWLQQTFDSGVYDDHLNQSILSDLGLKFRFNKEQIINSFYFKAMTAIEYSNYEEFRDIFNPRDIVVLEADPRHVMSGFVNEKLESIKNELDDCWKNLDKEKLITTGGDTYGINPLNGANIIYFFKIPNNNIIGKFGKGPRYAVGHSHTVYQFFKITSIFQALTNVHFTNSTLSDIPETVYEMMAKHLGVDIKILEVDTA